MWRVAHLLPPAKQAAVGIGACGCARRSHSGVALPWSDCASIQRCDGRK